VYESYPSGTQFFDGKLDEVRISTARRSAAWIKASYNSEMGNLIKAFASEKFLTGNFDETVSCSDSILAAKLRSITLSDIASYSDQIYKNISRILSETAVHTATITKSIGRNLSEAVNYSDIWAGLKNGLRAGTWAVAQKITSGWNKVAKITTSWSIKAKNITAWTKKPKP
jgi:hypothetical protein